MPPRMSGSRRRASRCSSSSPCSLAERQRGLNHVNTPWAFARRLRMGRIGLSIEYVCRLCVIIVIQAPYLQARRASRKTHQGVFIYMQQPARACRLWQAAYCLPLTSCSARGSVCNGRWEAEHTHTDTRLVYKFVVSNCLCSVLGCCCFCE